MTTTNDLRIGVLVSGDGSNLQSIIDHCEAGDIEGEVAVVVSDKEEAYGLARAEKHGIPARFVDPRTYESRESFDEELARILTSHGVELVCLAGYLRILSPGFVDSFPDRIMNIHPALLPAFPGLRAQQQALEHGVKVTGCTVHFVDDRVDHGPIIIQQAVAVREDDDLESLRERILEEEHRIYPQAIRLFAAGRLSMDGRRVRVASAP